jgi:hypothetical protein
MLLLSLFDLVNDVNLIGMNSAQKNEYLTSY